MVGSEGRTIGEFTDDRGIHAIVKVRLIKEADIVARRINVDVHRGCLLYTSPSPRDGLLSRMPSSA